MNIQPMIMYDQTQTNSNIVFDPLNKMIKKNGNIFLLGEPSNNITMLILKIYHENMVRCFNKLSSTPDMTDPHMFMTGMLQLSGDDSVYVTISESTREGPEYDAKFKDFYSLLVYSGCTVEHGEGEDFDFGPINNYREGHETDFSEENFQKIRGFIYADKENPNCYSSYIKDYRITVKLIQSTEYLKKRENGKSFVPFKKWEKDAYGKTVVKCIHGSLCVEAKLFGFIYNQGRKYEDVSGYVAYWVANKPPPQHFLEKYSYTFNSETHSEEYEKLENMYKTSYANLNEETKRILLNSCNNGVEDSEDKSDECKKRHIYALQPIALTCPGCFMNWRLYVNNIQSNWDTTDCQRYKGGIKLKKTKTRRHYKKYKKNGRIRKSSKKT